MERQLTLLEEPADWRFSDETKRIGLQGVARARAVLRDSQRNSDHAERARSAEVAGPVNGGRTPRAA